MPHIYSRIEDEFIRYKDSEYEITSFYLGANHLYPLIDELTKMMRTTIDSNGLKLFGIKIHQHKDADAFEVNTKLREQKKNT